jgi:hypothetical protein
VRFHVLKVARKKIIVFRDIAPRRLIKVDRRFRGIYCLHHQDDEIIALIIVLLKRRSTSTRLHGTISQEVVVLKMLLVLLMNMKLRGKKALTVLRIKS